MALEIRTEGHPLLAATAFVTRFPRPLGELGEQAPLVSRLALDVDAPVARDEELRKAVRDLLRHGGYRPTGRGKPASEYLVRAAGEGRLGPINAAVDACNAVSLASGFPISVVDVERLAPSALSIAVAPEGARFVFNAAGQEIDLRGLLCLFDAEGPCANAVKDSQRTKTSEGTTSTLSVVWGCEPFAARVAATTEWYPGALGRGRSRDRASRRLRSRCSLRAALCSGPMYAALVLALPLSASDDDAGHTFVGPIGALHTGVFASATALDAFPTAAVASADGARVFAVARTGSTVQHWHAFAFDADGAPLWDTHHPLGANPFFGADYDPVGVDLAGGALAVVGTKPVGASLVCFDATTGAERFAVTHSPAPNAATAAHGVAFSADGARVYLLGSSLTGCYPRRVRRRLRHGHRRRAVEHDVGRAGGLRGRAGRARRHARRDPRARRRDDGDHGGPPVPGLGRRRPRGVRAGCGGRRAPVGADVLGDGSERRAAGRPRALP